MDPFQEYLQENIGFEGDEDPSTFEEFLDPEEYIDLGHLFTTDRIFSSKDELVEWAKQIAMNAKTFLIITQYQRARTFDRRPYVTLACERGGSKIYNVVAKIKRDRMQGRNTVEEVLCLSAERGYTVFYRNGEDSNVLSDIVVAHPTSIAMRRTWPYVLIMDTTYKMNKESGLMSVIDDVFSNSYHILCRRHIDQNVLTKLIEMVKDGEAAQRVWSSQVIHFGVETTNHTESEHSVLKLWLSTRHGDLDTVLLNIDSLIQAQVSEIKYSLEI
ncbi:hypothetical protein M9H77_31895 [Catharanthus roseus]|uniref:Uncharacterized protein n=1 Tax=Catharanthus roseus TaxID=4058 RepID=A0ACC0A3Q9_CATRO|nr:hypothetical protein M9H77_31895 [Catharanthus roseus]